MEFNTSPSPTAENQRDESIPRELPTTEAEVYGDDTLLEEETLSWFDPQKWYPVRLGEVIESRYQVLVKLGFGSVSTAWLCRDLRRHTFVTLKVYETGHRQGGNETTVFHHLQSLPPNETQEGRKLIRTVQRAFQITGPVGPHICLIYHPLCMSLEDLRLMVGGKLPTYVLKPFIYDILRGLSYLHEVAKIVHTDLQAGNIMLSTETPQVWEDLVQEEWDEPAPRKMTKTGSFVYEPKSPDIPEDGIPIICDFGEARVGDGPFIGEVMPDLYRAPEIILYIPWTEKVDIWGLGLMIWDLLEGKPLFKKRLPSREASRGPHIARMVSLLDNPPKDLLSRSEYSSEFFNEDGNPNPGFQDTSTNNGICGGSLEEEEEILEAEEKDQFLSFMRRMLQWRPEDRPTARELIDDPWLKM